MINLNNHRKNIYTNAGVRPCPGYGEDGVIEEIFLKIGTSKKPKCIEFGESRVLGTTSRAFRISFFADAFYFSGSLDLKSRLLNVLDVLKIVFSNKNLNYLKFFLTMPKKIFVTPENISQVIPRKYIASEIDLLIVYIDSYDFEIVSLIRKIGIKPRVVIVEYNPSLPITGTYSWDYKMKRQKDTNPRLYGASYGCWSNFFEEWSYNLVHISGFCNLIYIRGDLDNNFKVPDIYEEITNTNEKVLDFVGRYCLEGFKPSWLDAPYLTSEEVMTLTWGAKENLR